MIVIKLERFPDDYKFCSFGNYGSANYLNKMDFEVVPRILLQMSLVRNGGADVC